MCVFVWVSVCLCLYFSVCLCLCLSVFVFVWVCVCLGLCLSMFVFFWVCVCMGLCLSVFVFVWVCVCLCFSFKEAWRAWRAWRAWSWSVCALVGVVAFYDPTFPMLKRPAAGARGSTDAQTFVADKADSEACRLVSAGVGRCPPFENLKVDY